MQSSKKLILAIDTSSSPLLLAAGNGEKIFSVRKSGVKQERLLFPSLEKLLQKADAQMQDIGKIFLIRGPGRFTGIRISLTFASMLQYLNETEVYGATMFEVLHEQAKSSSFYADWKKKNPSGSIAVVLHVFREEYFLQFFDEDNQPPVWVSKEELLNKLAAYSRSVYVTGFDKDRTSLDLLLGEKYYLAPFKDCLPQPQTLLHMAMQTRYKQNALEPLYLKPARFELVTPV